MAAEKEILEAPVPVLNKEDTFFTKTGVDLTWNKSWTLSVQPQGDINSDTVVFDIPKMTAGEYYFLHDMKLRMCVRLEDKDGKPLNGATDNVAPVNNIAQSLWSDVKLFLNNTQVSAGTNSMYPYYCYLYNLLNFEKGKQDGSLRMQGFTLDNEADWNTNYQYQQKGYVLRRQFFGTVEDDTTFIYNKPSDSGPAVFIGPVMTDFSRTRRPMVSDVGGRLELTKSSKEFYLMTEPGASATEAVEDEVPETGKKRKRRQEDSEEEAEEEDSEGACWSLGAARKRRRGEDGEESVADDPTKRTFKQVGARLKITSLTLLIPTKKMNESLNLKIEDRLAKEALLYQTTRMDLRKYKLEKGSNSFYFQDIKTPKTSPDRIFMMVVSNSDLQGDTGGNPFRFSNSVTGGTTDAAKIDLMRLTVNNVSLESFETSTFYDTFTRKFAELNDVLGYNRTSSQSLPFTIRDYEMINFVVGYDLTSAANASLLGPNVRGRINNGVINLELHFDHELPSGAWLLMLSEFHSGISVDKNRNVVYRYMV